MSDITKIRMISLVFIHGHNLLQMMKLGQRYQH